ncbi:2-succinyl-5-enolpyruvyl-6-hydroxy-3-cyclohexene-1-carboxylic-acid synthase [Pseudoglutamicibacter cumminsii]|uniref:2-succinyl-5-enolpyruvyl-6-hydroxy-3- cyclohexene-1-carboxylic-acid synthase n=1 Tax=Pseudoglutamicibacter cumminsii TaxID=156979 RepID=UPI0026EF4BA3|nr:2-succinyl-5-enolpyruvyl-6-hydroxy-3-cyclohexene-1-carboxylic-acid synthase [Pseudoglutamicibacter cumminsii]
MPSLSAVESARLIVQGCVSAGMQHVVVAPGSRSAPLAYALAEAERDSVLSVHARLDEREAGFLALGLAMASDAPVAVVTTSGSAVANLFPALMEAAHAGVKLVLLTADRPERLHETGASQTTQQAGIFGQHTRASVHVPAGEDPTGLVAEALVAGLGNKQYAPGPVHINCAFEDPLYPSSDAMITGEERPADVSARRHPELSDVELLEMDALAATIPVPRALSRETLRAAAGEGDHQRRTHNQRRTVVIAGHDAGEEAAHFAHALDLPLLAEPSSNARQGENALTAYQFTLSAFADQIEAVVLFGRPTLSRPINALLAREEIPSAIYAPGPLAWCDLSKRREAPVRSFAEAAEFAGVGPEGWVEAWREADDRVVAAVNMVVAEREQVTGRLTGPSLAADVWAGLYGPAVIGSSRPVRDMDIAATPRRGRGPRVYANRGLAGIDGTISTAAGIALAERRRTLAFMGDVTLLYGAPGMLVPSLEAVPQLDVVVADDGGGTIFSTLEHGSVAARGGYREAVDRFFRVPHGLDVVELARAYGWDAQRVSSHEQVREWLDAGRTASGCRLLVVDTEREKPRELHRALAAAAMEALAELG